MSDEAVEQAGEAPAPTEAPVTVAPPVVETKNWRDDLPEDIRADPALVDIKDVGSLAKSMIHAQKLVGMDRSKLLTIPSEDAPAEEWDDFYTKTGRPESADKYQLTMPEGVELDSSEDMTKWYKETAHKTGLTTKQAQALYSEYMAYANSMVQTDENRLERSRTEGESALRKEWGAAYETRVKEAVAPLRNHADKEFLDYLDTSGLGNHPGMLKFLHKISKTLGEDTVNDPSQNNGVMSPSEAEAQIAQKMNDAEFMKAYKKADHPSHKWAVAEMTKLHQYQYAGR